MNVLEKSHCLESNKAIHKRHTIKKPQQPPFTHLMKPIVIHTSLESHICSIKLCYQPQCASVSQNLWQGCLIYTEVFAMRCHSA